MAVDKKEYMDPKYLEDGKVLISLKKMFLASKSVDDLGPVLGCLRDSMVVVPMNIIKSGDKFYFPIFSRTEELPKDYSAEDSSVRLPVTKCIEMATNMEGVSGLVLDAFTEPLILDRDIAKTILTIPSKLGLSL